MSAPISSGGAAAPLTTLHRALLVFAGGAVGTALRAGLGLLSSWGADAGRSPSSSAASAAADALITSAVATFTINIVGAFLLGYLLERLTPRPAADPTSAPLSTLPANSVSRGRLERRAHALRLLLGTGALGGFTTYSALAVDTALIGSTDAATATVYAVVTLLVGGLASAAGIAAGAVARPGFGKVFSNDTPVDGDG